MHKALLVILVLSFASPVFARSDYQECRRKLNHNQSRQDVYERCGAPSYREAGRTYQSGPNIYQEEKWVYDYSYEGERTIVIQFDSKGEIKRFR